MEGISWLLLAMMFYHSNENTPEMVAFPAALMKMLVLAHSLRSSPSQQGFRFKSWHLCGKRVYSLIHLQ
ncbi:hypothetical protein LEMLEM_LOCUS22766 [Lemmus lemmus]